MQYKDKSMISMVDFEKLVDSMPSAVLMLDRDAVILMANKQAEEFAGNYHKDLIGMKPGKAFRCVRFNEEVNGCDTTRQCEICFAVQMVHQLIAENKTRLSGEGRIEFEEYGPLDLRVTVVNLAEQKAVLMILEDVTAWKALEHDRVVKDKLQAAMETAGAICHEMNQPLQVISGYLDLLMTTGIEVDSNSAKYLEISREQLDRLTKIIRKLNNLRSYHTDSYPGGSEILDIAKSSLR
jgi:nitrogen-specific signal transduction histidine kinase